MTSLCLQSVRRPPPVSRGNFALLSLATLCAQSMQLYMYSHPELLRPLQGTCVSYVIGVSEPHEGRVAVAMEMPHPVGWKEVDAYESDAAKDAIMHAYKTLHSRGILHGHVQHEHVLLGDLSIVVMYCSPSDLSIM